MLWNRSLSLVVCVLVGACTRDNPAFDEGGDELLDGSETSDGAGSDSDTSTDTGGVAECDYDPGKRLVIEMPLLCPLAEGSIYHERSFLVSETVSDGWLGRICPLGDLGCSDPAQCEGNPLRKVKLGPFDVAGLAEPDECLVIKAARLDLEAGAEQCDFDAIGVWKNGIPIVVASNGNALVGEALAAVGDFEITPEHVEDPQCECIEACCDPGGLGDFAFEVGGQLVPVGEVLELDGLPYAFHALAANNPSGCDEDLQFDWAITYRAP